MRPYRFSYLARRSQTEDDLNPASEIGSILTRGLLRRVTTIAWPFEATRSQISEHFVLA